MNEYQRQWLAESSGDAADMINKFAERLGEAEAHIAKLRHVLLHYWGTTDPELLAEVWADRAPVPSRGPSA